MSVRWEGGSGEGKERVWVSFILGRRWVSFILREGEGKERVMCVMVSFEGRVGC